MTDHYYLSLGTRYVDHTMVDVLFIEGSVVASEPEGVGLESSGYKILTAAAHVAGLAYPEVGPLVL
jgi:hypothetical protein